MDVVFYSPAILGILVKPFLSGSPRYYCSHVWSTQHVGYIPFLKISLLLLLLAFFHPDCFADAIQLTSHKSKICFLHLISARKAWYLRDNGKRYPWLFHLTEFKHRYGNILTFQLCSHEMRWNGNRKKNEIEDFDAECFFLSFQLELFNWHSTAKN